MFRCPNLLQKFIRGKREASGIKAHKLTTKADMAILQAAPIGAPEADKIHALNDPEAATRFSLWNKTNIRQEVSFTSWLVFILSHYVHSSLDKFPSNSGLH